MVAPQLGKTEVTMDCLRQAIHSDKIQYTKKVSEFTYKLTEVFQQKNKLVIDPYSASSKTRIGKFHFKCDDITQLSAVILGLFAYYTRNWQTFKKEAHLWIEHHFCLPESS